MIADKLIIAFNLCNYIHVVKLEAVVTVVQSDYCTNVYTVFISFDAILFFLKSICEICKNYNFFNLKGGELRV